MNEATKDFILLCIVGYVVWLILLTLWQKFANWWRRRFFKKRTGLKCPRRELTVEQILGKSKFNVQEERAKQQEREQQYQRQEKEKQELAKKEEMRINALALEMAEEIVKKRMKLQPLPEEPPKPYPKVIPVEELDAVFSSEEVLPDYSMPDKLDKMMIADSATTISELENVAKVLKNKETTTQEQQQEAVKVIAKIGNTFVLEQMLSKVDGATKYASHLIEKHYTEQLTPHSKPLLEDFDMDKYLNY